MVFPNQHSYDIDFVTVQLPVVQKDTFFLYTQEAQGDWYLAIPLSMNYTQYLGFSQIHNPQKQWEIVQA
jgi:hypothetical protein